MRKKNTELYTLLTYGSAVVISLCQGTVVTSETLIPVDSMSYVIGRASDYEVPITALILGGDSIIAGSGGGVWARFNGDLSWKELIAVTAKQDWSLDCSRKKQLSTLFQPEQIWRVYSPDNIVVFEGYCGRLMKLVLSGTGAYIAEVWKESPGGYSLNSACMQNGLLFGGYCTTDRKLLVTADADPRSDYRGLLEYPPSLERKLDSIGLNYAYCRPAFDPANNSIWISVYGYNYIYIADLHGKLLDSIAITSPDYITPSPPVSRIRSKAVWNDWLSKWTPIRTFRYIPPGYFFLQYRTGWQKYGVDSIPLYSTQVWNADGRPVALEIKKDWQLAGVQDDGRVIFGRYATEGESLRVELTVMRVER